MNIPSQRETPEQAAARSYNQGLKQRDKAVKLEMQLEEARNEKARLKIEKKMTKEFQRAIKSFRFSIKKKPDLFQAHSSLGFVLRKTGQYEEALNSYNEALLYAPNYPEALEYRAEAYLGLDRLDDAKSSYLLLFRLDPGKAGKLLVAMQDWVQKRQMGESANSSQIEGFADWVQSRSKIAEQTSPEGTSSHWE